MELLVRLGGDGLVRQVSIIRSSRYYSIDHAVLSELGAYRFDTRGLPPEKTWRVFFSWSEDGRKTSLSSKCAILK